MKTERSREELLELVTELKDRLKKRTEELTRTRQRLNKAKSTIQRLKGIVTYQRDRILQLYN